MAETYRIADAAAETLKNYDNAINILLKDLGTRTPEAASPSGFAACSNTRPFRRYRGRRLRQKTSRAREPFTLRLRAFNGRIGNVAGGEVRAQTERHSLATRTIRSFCQIFGSPSSCLPDHTVV